jgi:hypothetical protein
LPRISIPLTGGKYSVQAILQLLIGVIACGALIFVARRLSPERELRLYAVSLVIAALIYVGFTLRGATAAWLSVELAGLLAFTLLAWLGLKMSALILALAWTAHAAWDVLLHQLPDVAFVPDWYPVICVGFDLLLAGYIVARVRSNAFKKDETGEKRLKQ